MEVDRYLTFRIYGLLQKFKIKKDDYDNIIRVVLKLAKLILHNKISKNFIELILLLKEFIIISSSLRDLSEENNYFLNIRKSIYVQIKKNREYYINIK